MDKIASALVKAQRQFAPALKTATNPHFKSKYADLSACVEAVLDSLNAAGVFLMQRQHPNEGGVSIETIFVHESGETLSAGILSVPAAKQDPQGYGSALTYARRYSLMAACGIAPEDDDGNAASKAKRPDKPAVAHSGPAIAFSELTPDWQAWVTDWARDVANLLEQAGPQAAVTFIKETMEKEGLDPNHHAAMFAKLDSKQRSAINAVTK